MHYKWEIEFRGIVEADTREEAQEKALKQLREEVELESGINIWVWSICDEELV